MRVGFGRFTFDSGMRTLLAGRDPRHSGLTEAMELLDTATSTVLGAAGATNLEWTSDKDRSAAERVRLSIADLLDRLRP